MTFYFIDAFYNRFALFGKRLNNSTGFAFAALKSDGSVVTWGDGSNGGNSSAVAARMPRSFQPE